VLVRLQRIRRCWRWPYRCVLCSISVIPSPRRWSQSVRSR
jgi:hypothetical protein